MGKFCTRFAAYENLIGRYRALGVKGELIMSVDVIKKSSMVGKNVKFVLGTRGSLLNSDRILQKVEMYIDGQSGAIYVVPVDDSDLVSEFQFKITE